MATKKVSISARPTTAEVPSADAWVANREAGEGGAAVPSGVTAPDLIPEPMKRLTIDLPESLHHALKLYCLNNRTTIAEVARELFANKCGLTEIKK